MAKRKTLRFRKWKWLLCTFQLNLDYGLSREQAMKEATELMDNCGWLERCEGKTKKQMEREHWATFDGWFVEE